MPSGPLRIEGNPAAYVLSDPASGSALDEPHDGPLERVAVTHAHELAELETRAVGLGQAREAACDGATDGVLVEDAGVDVRAAGDRGGVAEVLGDDLHRVLLGALELALGVDGAGPGERHGGRDGGRPG